MNERLVNVDPKLLRKPGPDGQRPDDFAVQRILISLAPRREYLVNAAWASQLPQEGQKLQRTRAVFDLEQFRAGKDIYFAWKDLMELKQKRKTDNPVLPEAIIERLANARLTEEPVTLFVPWGARTEGKPNLEEKVMDRIAEVQSILEDRRIPSQVLIMPADAYATEVNRQVSQKKAQEYFSKVWALGTERGFTIQTWSSIRALNMDYYKRRAEESTEKEIRSLLPPSTTEECLAAAKRRSGYTLPTQINDAAFAYMRERIVEAEIIEDMYQPIKISAVSKKKDNNVDRNLPRLYLIPEGELFPWLS